MTQSRLVWLAITLVFAASFAEAMGARPSALHVVRPWARATAPGQPSAAVYLTIDNQGSTADRLIGVSSPVADTATLHAMSMQGDVMQMREADNVTVAAGASVAMKPGSGFHIMLTGLHQPLKVGQPIALQLRFRQAGALRVMVEVEAVGGSH